MPPIKDEMTVHTERRSEGAFIMFVSQENTAVDLDSAPLICKIEHYDGYTTFRMPEAYTVRMLFAEFSALTNGQRILPTPC
jgi:hypothetical protein